MLPYLSYYKTEINTSNTVWRKIYLNDGSVFENQKGNCIDFKYDVNGDKLPNKLGSDTFLFVYCPTIIGSKTWQITGTFIPYMKYQYDRNTAFSYCKTDAAYCSALLAIDGWEFKSDYPHRL